ncbi:MAG: hypothetical protein J6U01_03905 [Clostridia bacterium]|nr:hypothetical protein [Clostridia bacterium]
MNTQVQEETERIEGQEPLLFRMIRRAVICFSPRYRHYGTENLPDEACILVGNHAQMYGPIAAELFMPRRCYIWCIGEMMNRKEVPAYALRDFWHRKPKALQWFYKMMAHLIARPAEYIFTYTHTIPVYHDLRIMNTFRQSCARLQEGKDLLIFPEKDERCNRILCQFQENFVDLAVLYYRRTGRAIRFVPMYITPKLKGIYFGKPVQFRPDAPIQEERIRVCEELIETITGMASALPEHIVIPYENIPRKQYPRNK